MKDNLYISTVWMLIRRALKNCIIAVAVFAGCAIGTRDACAECIENCILDIIWEARLSGMIGVQSFDQNVQPFMAKRPLTSATFLTSVLGRTPSAEEVLALRFRLEPGRATLSLVVFHRQSRVIVQTIASEQPVSLFMDGRRGAFTGNASLPFGVTLQGGTLQIAGRVTQVRNVPARIKGSVQGVIVAPASSSPPFGTNLTGIVMGGRIQTLRAPLRVEPPIIPQPLFFP